MPAAVLVTKPNVVGAYEQRLLRWFDLPLYTGYFNELNAPGEAPVVEFCWFKDWRPRSIFRNPTVSRFEYARYSLPEHVDTVVSVGLVAKEISTPNRHIHLAHGNHRGAFGLPPRDEFSLNPVLEVLQKTNRRWLRRREKTLLSRVDTIVANSEFTADEMERFYGISPDTIIHPPINIGQYDCHDQREPFYLYLGRLDPEKRVLEIIRAFNELPHRLVVAGSGRLESEAKSTAGENVDVVGYVGEERKRELFATCSGFVQNTVAEPFGITTVEALASGAPVVAVNDGNNPTLIDDGVNGILFDRPDGGWYQSEPSEAEIRDAVARAELIDWDRQRIRESTAPYDSSVCREEWQRVLEGCER